MKKKKPQSQSQTHRKNIPKSSYHSNNILHKHRTNIINTFRQAKEKEILESEQIKKNLNEANKESPKTIDYIQVMNKYSHLIDNNHPQNMSSNNIDDKDIYKYNNYYIKTDCNQEKKNMANILPNNPYNNSSNNPNSINLNKNDNYFQFCRTDYENDKDKNNFKYYTLKNFYSKKKSSSDLYNNNIDIKNKNNNIENSKINNILMSYNRNINVKTKNRENVYSEDKNYNLHRNRNNKMFYNSNLHNNVSLRKMSKKNNSSNSHSLNNININKTNKYFNGNDNKENKNYFNNISLSNDILYQFNSKSQNIFNTNNYSDKIHTFINLCQKYAKNLSNCMNYIEINHNTIFNNNDYLDELKYIINQYNKFIFSDKIKDYLNIHNSDKKHISDSNLNEFEPKTLNLAEKFRNKIKDLKSEKSEINNELILYKKKNKSLIMEKEELNLINSQLMKENEELNNKIQNMINLENKCYHQNNMIEKLKCQIETLNIDIRYKENIINNLQQILEQIKIKSNLMNNNNNNTNDSDNIKNNNINKTNNNPAIINKKTSLKDLGNEYIIKGINNTSDFLLDVNSESIEKDIIIPLNLKVNSIKDIKSEEFGTKKNENDSEIIFNNKEESEANIMKLIQNLKSKKNNKSILLCNKDESEILSKEMEKIDQDILNLKTKLKKIISK